MSDIIHLLPDSVANRIAAGEVVQRPASAVKELMENAIDAGADTVALNIKDSGKTLIQVVDNGCGMSDTDARLSFERHATSKISSAEELWNIRTKGFRGEALASIAAIAHVEMKTRLHDVDLGTKVVVEGSEVKGQEPIATAPGTSIAVKNIYFNTPARRNFLKSDAVEMRHVVEEFERIALVHPDVNFTLHHNDNELFNLRATTLRQRVVNVFGAKYNERLVPVKEQTDIVSVEGFIGKPEFARKTRGEQYFFVNDRFIKNNYLHHAVKSAYEDLISHDAHPSYFIYLRVDPKTLDVNIHPTKTEVKFSEERFIYAIIRSAVRNSLGKYNISPSLDFEPEAFMNISPMPRDAKIEPPSHKEINFNPFDKEKSGGSRRTAFAKSGNFGGNWQDLYHITEKKKGESQGMFDRVPVESPPHVPSREGKQMVLDLHGKYIWSRIRSGFIIVHRRRAHERVLFEEALKSLDNQAGWSQQELFPKTIELSASDAELIKDLSEDLRRLGFTIDGFGTGTIVVHGVPAEAVDLPVEDLIDGMLDRYKNSADDLRSDHRRNLARSLASGMSIKDGQPMEKAEMIHLIDRLFACEQPALSPSGKPVILTFDIEDIDKKFMNL